LGLGYWVTLNLLANKAVVLIEARFRLNNGPQIKVGVKVICVNRSLRLLFEVLRYIIKFFGLAPEIIMSQSRKSLDSITAYLCGTAAATGLVVSKIGDFLNTSTTYNDVRLMNLHSSN